MRPLPEKIICRRVKDEVVRKSGIIMVTPEDKKTAKFEVVEINEEDGNASGLARGSIIIADRFNGVPFEHNKERLYLYDIYDVICIVDESKSGMDKYTIPYNYVIVDYTKKNDEYELAGEKIYLDTTYRKEYHYPTFGTLLKNPERLTYFGYELNYNRDAYSSQRTTRLMKGSTKHDTILETEPGDVVHFHYLSVEVSIKAGLYIEEEDNKYAILRYDSLYAAERGEEVIMLNGYVAVSIDMLPKEKEVSGLTVLDLREGDKRRDWGRGKIAYIGSTVSDYLHSPGRGDAVGCEVVYDEQGKEISLPPQGRQYCVGDRVNFKVTKKSKIGKDEHMEWSKLNDLYYLQRKDINYTYV